MMRRNILIIAGILFIQTPLICSDKAFMGGMGHKARVTAEKTFVAGHEVLADGIARANSHDDSYVKKAKEIVDKYQDALNAFCQAEAVLDCPSDTTTERGQTKQVTIDQTTYDLTCQKTGEFSFTRPFTYTIPLEDAPTTISVRTLADCQSKKGQLEEELRDATQRLREQKDRRQHFINLETNKIVQSMESMDKAGRATGTAVRDAGTDFIKSIGIGFITEAEGATEIEKHKKSLENDLKKHEMTMANVRSIVKTTLIAAPLVVGTSAALYFLAKTWIPLLLKKSPSYMRTSILSPFARWFKRVKPEESRMQELQFGEEQTAAITDVFNDFKRCIDADIELTNMMFYGPPGTGKTMTARAIALELGCEYILVNSPELSQLPDEEAIQALKYVIELAKRSKKPCIVFFDEADAIFMHRGHAPVKERKMTNELLSLLPEAYAKGFACIFATNLPNALDPAFKRRIGRKLYFGLPDHATRTTMLEQYLQKFADRCNLGLDQELRTALPDLAAQLNGFSGSDMAELAHEIRLATLKENLNSITLLVSQSVISRKLKENQLEASTTYDHTAASKPQEVEHHDSSDTASTPYSDASDPINNPGN